MKTALDPGYWTIKLGYVLQINPVRDKIVFKTYNYMFVLDNSSILDLARVSGILLDYMYLPIVHTHNHNCPFDYFQ